jgi:N-formylglutamate amidohydrolase
MALLPYTLIEPQGALVPMVVDSPHSGRIYPVDFAYACPLPLLRQAEDAYVDEIIIGAAEAGATVLVAEFPRSMIDVNRAENDIDPAVIDGVWPEALMSDPMTLLGLGLVRRLCRSGISLYRAPLSIAEIQRRLDVYYRPYHDCLKNMINARIKKFGVCYYINMHSMPDRVDNGILRPDFILGDRDGTSCDRSLTLLAQKILQDMGYSVTFNNPYRGRELVSRYGLRGMGAQALQIEINRKLYLDETRSEKTAAIDGLRDDMTEFFKVIAATIQSNEDDRLAAE